MTGASAGLLDFTIYGVAGRKSIQRMRFVAGTQVPSDRLGGLWWGGAAQNGWGLTINQQDETLFVVWYTYDQDGSVAWYVMSGGTWTSADTYSGALYRTRGSAWIGVEYDKSRLEVTRVGTMTLRFSGSDAADLSYSVDGVSGSASIVRQQF